HRVTNVGSGLFRLIAVTNHGAGSPTDRPKDDIPGNLEIDDQFFRAWRLTLQPGQASPWFRSSQALVGVHVSGGEIEVQRRSGEPSALKASGEWFFGDAGTEYRIRSPGEHALELVLVQAR
ncbi:MAG: cupin domain-containing protein, partial [Longimicrobiales bacterium]